MNGEKKIKQQGKLVTTLFFSSAGKRFLLRHYVPLLGEAPLVLVIILKYSLPYHEINSKVHFLLFFFKKTPNSPSGNATQKAVQRSSTAVSCWAAKALGQSAAGHDL